jgi:hypothetical protein
MLKSQAKIYCEQTTLHGFKYLKRNRAEKWFWIVSMILMFFSTIYLMNKLIVSLQKNPIIISKDDSAISVTEIYFPAVTLCPGLIIATDVERVFDYENVKESLENGEMSFDNLTKSE